MRTGLTVVAVFVTFCGLQCQSYFASAQGSSIDNEVSCDFEKDLCNWTASGENWRFWQRSDVFSRNSNHFAQLDVSSESSGFKRSLVSSKLNPNSGFSCRLNFSYSIEKRNRCRLSVYQKFEDDLRTETLLWNSTNSSNFSSNPVQVEVNCSHSRYQISFEGMRISSRSYPCGDDFNGIKIDDIKYIVSGSLTTTNAHTLRTNAPTLWTNTSTLRTDAPTLWTNTPTLWTSVQTASNNSQDPSPHVSNNNSRLGSGSIAGIVIAVFAVVAIAVIVGFVALRRRKFRGDLCLFRCFEKNPKRSLGTVPASNAAINSTCPTANQQKTAGGDTIANDEYATIQDAYDDLQPQNSTSVPQGHELAASPHGSSFVNQISADQSDDYYNQVDLQDSSPTISEPTSEAVYINTQVQPDGKIVVGQVVYAVCKKGKKVPEDASQVGHQHSSQQTYHLLQEPDSLAAHQDVSMDDSEAVYALAGPLTLDTVAMADKQEMSGSAVLDDAYNTLKEPEHSQLSQNHYSNLNRTSAEYNHLNHEGRTKDLQREITAVDYSHV